MQMASSKIRTHNLRPSRPNSVVAGDRYDHNSIKVHWLPPSLSGGLTVTQYKIEWSPQSDFSSDVNSALQGMVYEIQTLTTFAGDNSMTGTFIVSYSGQQTAAINYNADASTMKARLESLNGIGIVDVTRTSASNGYAWTVTFKTEDGDLPLLTSDAAGLQSSSGNQGVSIAEVTRGYGAFEQQHVFYMFSVCFMMFRTSS